MDKLEKNYNSLFIELRKEDYKEAAHSTQDEIYRKFIKDIRTKNFLTLHDINKKVVKYDKNR
jgi:hypothetical protein